MGGNVPHEQARFYLQHYLLRHETEFTQCIQSQAQVQAKTGKAIAESIFAKFLPAFGPSWKSRLQRRNLDYKDPADQLIGMMLLQITTNHECLPSFKRKEKKNWFQF